MGNWEWGMGNGEWGSSSFPRSLFPTPHSLLFALSDDDSRAVKLRQFEAFEVFVIAIFEILQNTDRHRLAEFERLPGVGPPVHARAVAAEGDVGRQLVQLAAHGQARTA